MSEAHTGGPVHSSPFAAMLHGAVLPMALTAPVIVPGFWIARPARRGLAALVGVGVAVALRAM